ncbi:MAG: hydroxymethylglutaryl-CoA lyase [Chloroflexi bacterium]|nr:hydroxymethylglutaryl-CoA lyase [Chloroflexota bacterium]
MLQSLPRRVRIVEVGPRDGLQNEGRAISTADKVRFIDLLSEAGFEMIEATSFVHPKAVPQLADGAEVLGTILKRPGVRYPVLVPNGRGMERALAAGAREVAVFTAATESFNRRNINATIEESLGNIAEVVRLARAEGVWVRGYVSTVFGCPYQGAVAPEAVLHVAERLLELGVDELSLGDTIGVATPRVVEAVLAPAAERFGVDRVGLHFHDTRGTALANTLLALQMGYQIFDSSAGGLGGCPFALGAAGNLATEDLLYFLNGLGIETGVNLETVISASGFIEDQVGHPLTSKVYQAVRSQEGERCSWLLAPGS